MEGKVMMVIFLVCVVVQWGVFVDDDGCEIGLV